MTSRRLGVLAHLTLAVVWLAVPTRAPAQDSGNAVCASCHDVAQKMTGTVHAAVDCARCHQKHEEYPHPANIPKPVCGSCHGNQSAQFNLSVHAEVARAGNASAPECSVCHGAAHEVKRPSSAEFRTGVADTCGMCHDKESSEFKTSVHGKAIASGSMKAATCSDCHGEHAIQRPKNPASSVNAKHIPETCGQCHGGVKLASRFRIPLDRVASFDSSFHGLALRSGQLAVANCASCHGIHGILSSADPKSMVNQKNLPQTCGKCHSGAGRRFALGPVHQVENKTEPASVAYVRGFYFVIIPATLGFMFLHNLGDWIRKLRQLRFNGGKPYVEEGTVSREIRMMRAERWQHFLLLTSFTVLTWTGFALVYPDQWWTRPLLLFENRWPVRGTVHRIASVVFMIVTLVHAITLVKSERLRNRWKTLFPKWRDVTDAMRMFTFNMGVGKERPVLPSHSYIEKAEYWAVVWGAVIMIATGLLLWANNWTLANMPKVVLDLAAAVHFYEAVLAALAILIWHIYYVMLDPDVYPMDPAWLTGISTRIRRKRNKEASDPAEAEQEEQHI
jgi:cytochrome b subunit of formate dehydrogenase